MEFLEAVLPPSEDELEVVLHDYHANFLKFIETGPQDNNENYLLFCYSTLRGCELGTQMIADLASILEKINDKKIDPVVKDYRSLENVLIDTKKEIITSFEEKGILNFINGILPEKINVEVAEKYFAGTARLAIYEIATSDGCPETISQALEILSRMEYDGMREEDLILLDPQNTINTVVVALGSLSAKKQAFSEYAETYVQLKKETAIPEN